MTAATPPRGYEPTDHPETDRRAIYRWHSYPWRPRSRALARRGDPAAGAYAYAVPLPWIPAEYRPLLPDERVLPDDVMCEPTGSGPALLGDVCHLAPWAVGRWMGGAGGGGDAGSVDQALGAVICRRVDDSAAHEPHQPADGPAVTACEDCAALRTERDRLQRDLMRLESRRADACADAERARDAVAACHVWMQRAGVGPYVAHREAAGPHDGSGLGPDARADWSPRSLTVEFDEQYGEEFE